MSMAAHAQGIVLYEIILVNEHGERAVPS